jgi:chromosome partitioning protein
MAAVFPEDRYRSPPPVSADDLEQLYEDAAAVAQRAREAAFPPEAKKRLRRFNLREVLALLGVHPTDFYAAIDDPSNGLPQGEKVGAKRLFELEDVLKIQQHFKLLPRQRYGISRAVSLCIANFKGGVAKTFTATMLAQYFGMRGWRVLIVDLDPQASLTGQFDFDPSQSISDDQTFLPWYYGQAMCEQNLRESQAAEPGVEYESMWTGTLASSIRKTYWPSIDLVPANLSLYGGDFALGIRRSTDPGFQWHRPVADALDTIRDRYDLILIDTPPTLSFGTAAALFASDGLLIPAPAAQPDFESARAFLKMGAEVLRAAREFQGYEKTFEIFRALVTKYDPNVASQPRIANWIRGVFKEHALAEPMLLTSVAQNLGPRFKTIYEAEASDETAVVRGKDGKVRAKKISREALKRALDSANAVNRTIEFDVIETIKKRAHDAAQERAA